MESTRDGSVMPLSAVRVVVLVLMVAVALNGRRALAPPAPSMVFGWSGALGGLIAFAFLAGPSTAVHILPAIKLLGCRQQYAFGHHRLKR